MVCLLPPQFFYSLVSFLLSRLGPARMFLFFTYALHLWRIRTITFNITPSSSIFKHIILSVTLHNFTTLSTCSFFNMIPTPFFLFPLPQYHILYPPPMHLALSPPSSKFPAHTVCPHLFVP